MKAAIFDMDGLLIDSEPLWREAERAVFQTVGLELTDRMCEETMGFRLDEVIAYWQRQHPWNDKSLEQIHDEIVDLMKTLIDTRGVALDGAYDLLEGLQADGLGLALASSSPRILIEVVVEKLGLDPYFAVIRSAESERQGKPDPAVYLSTARLLDTAPSECVVFEDSVAGVRAAKAAGMTVIAVPAAEQFDEPSFGIADLKLKTLREFSLGMLEEHIRAGPKT